MEHKGTHHTAEDLAARAGELALRAREEAAPYVERASAEAAGLVAAAAPYVERATAEAAGLVAAAAPLVESAVETVSGVLEDAGHRGSAAWVALRGDEGRLPVPVRRWPWAVGAALAGAAAGGAVAYVLSRVRTADAEGAIDPAEVQAVVDRPETSPGAPVPPAV